MKSLSSLKSLVGGLCCLLLGAQSFAADAQPADVSQKEVKILVIGNSFTGNSLKYIKDIIKSAGGCSLRFEHAMIGGSSMEKHYSLAMKHEESPEAPEGMPYRMGGRNVGLKEMLQAEKWPLVSIQQHSAMAADVESFRPSAKNLVDYIKKYAPQAEIVIHQTWAYRDDSPFFKDGKMDQPKMYQAIVKAYQTIAAELGVTKIIPSANAYQLARETPRWTFKPDPSFDPKKAVHPALPKEEGALNVGYIWTESKKKDGKYFLSCDAKHANMPGEYLLGCVWFEYLFGKDVRPVSFKPEGLSEEDAASLREIAHKAVTEGAKPKLWPSDLK